jgi:hypothetical protein
MQALTLNSETNLDYKKYNKNLPNKVITNLLLLTIMTETLNGSESRKLKGVSLIEYILPSVLVLLGGIFILSQMQNGLGHQMQAMWSHSVNSYPNNDYLINPASQSPLPHGVNLPLAPSTETYCNANNDCITVTTDSLIETAATFGETQRSITANAELLQKLYALSKKTRTSPLLQLILNNLAGAAHTIGSGAGDLESQLSTGFQSGDVVTAVDSRFNDIKTKLDILTAPSDTRTNNGSGWDKPSVGNFYASYLASRDLIQNNAALKAELASLPGGQALIDKAATTIFKVTTNLNYQQAANGDIIVNVNPTAEDTHKNANVICTAGNTIACNP